MLAITEPLDAGDVYCGRLGKSRLPRSDSDASAVAYGVRGHGTRAQVLYPQIRQDLCGSVLSCWRVQDSKLIFHK